MESPFEARSQDLLGRRARNPFDVTKATDLTDDQIISTWVEIHSGALLELLHVDSTMPRFLIGGKGGGRTHLMRFSSYALQLKRMSTTKEVTASEFFEREGYLGLYFRCGGLNASRFEGKGVDREAWDAIFSYYTDLWLVRLYVQTLESFTRTINVQDPLYEHNYSSAIARLLNSGVDSDQVPSRSFMEILDKISAELASIDRAVNNAAISRQVNVEVKANPGSLIFECARLGAALLPGVVGLRIVYLLDEFENLTESQQRYINTLIREKELPINFVVGSRKYGIRTHGTLSAGEINIKGSEFDEIVLEEYYQRAKNQYEAFCKELVAQRLIEHGFSSPNDDLRKFFAVPPEVDRVGSAEALALLGRDVYLERPHMNRLKTQLDEHAELSGVYVEKIMQLMRMDSFPLLEKYAILLFYRNWASSGAPSVDAARFASDQASSLTNGDAKRVSRVTRTSFSHYRSDLLAQIAVRSGQPVGYYGLSKFILMSGYLPRNLLVTLKQITRWAAFQGEDPFRESPISLEAQRRGVRDSSSWFLKNTKAAGLDGEENDIIITRLGAFLRAMRMMDKPTDPSVCTIGVGRANYSRDIQRRLNNLVNHSLLIELPDGLNAKNGEDVLRKLQVHPLLAPSFDLSIARRGTTILTDQEVETLFDPHSNDQQLRALIRSRAHKLNAPFRTVPTVSTQGEDPEEVLF